LNFDGVLFFKKKRGKERKGKERKGKETRTTVQFLKLARKGREREKIPSN